MKDLYFTKQDYVDNVYNNYFWASSIDEVINICRKNPKKSLCIVLENNMVFGKVAIPAWSQLLIFSGTNGDMAGIAFHPNSLNSIYIIGYTNNQWKCRTI